MKRILFILAALVVLALVAHDSLPVIWAEAGPVKDDAWWRQNNW